jgi:hypothetical protein
MRCFIDQADDLLLGFECPAKRFHRVRKPQRLDPKFVDRRADVDAVRPVDRFRIGAAQASNDLRDFRRGGARTRGASPAGRNQIAAGVERLEPKPLAIGSKSGVWMSTPIGETPALTK